MTALSAFCQTLVHANTAENTHCTILVGQADEDKLQHKHSSITLCKKKMNRVTSFGSKTLYTALNSDTGYEISLCQLTPLIQSAASANMKERTGEKVACIWTPPNPTLDLVNQLRKNPINTQRRYNLSSKKKAKEDDHSIENSECSNKWACYSISHFQWEVHQQNLFFHTVQMFMDSFIVFTMISSSQVKISTFC